MNPIRRINLYFHHYGHKPCEREPYGEVAHLYHGLNNVMKLILQDKMFNLFFISDCTIL